MTWRLDYINLRKDDLRKLIYKKLIQEGADLNNLNRDAAMDLEILREPELAQKVRDSISARSKEKK